MAEHSDLISEMPFLEKLNTEERLKLARKRRSQQLKKWSQREKEYGVSKRKRQDEADPTSNRKNSGYKVHFVSSVMLLEAATRNDVEEVKRLLMLGVSPDSTNEDGLTALHQCCIDNCEEMMLLLIEFGANVNAKDSESWTPLHAASTCGHLHLIKILIDKGADLLAVNADGNMPYDICEDEQTLDYIESQMAHIGITQELIDDTRAMTENQMLSDMKLLAANGYDLNYKDEQGASPLHIAASNGYMSVVEFLLDHNVSTDEIDADGWQAIHAAACWGHIDVIEFLVQNGADLDAKTKNGETPFDICEDPDLKSRILQLRNEIESKRAVSSNRLRRSHSQNTRTHSIRRTSIREKSQIAKREAIEEARIWQEKSHDDEDARKEDEVDGDVQFYNEHNSGNKTSAFADSTSPIDLNNIDIKMESALDDDSYAPKPIAPYTNSSPSQNNCNALSNYNSNNQPNQASLSAHQQQAQSSVPVSVRAIKKASQVESSYYSNYYNEYQDHQNYNENAASNEHSVNSDSVKVEIHVTVNTSNNNSNANPNANNNYPNAPPPPNSAGTLIDLKKQRSERNRNSLGNIYTDRMKTPMEPQQQHHQHQVSHVGPKSTNLQQQFHQHSQSAGNSAPITSVPMANSKHAGGALHFDTPPSPSSFKKKFRGSTLVGEEEKTGGKCCIIC